MRTIRASNTPMEWLNPKPTPSCPPAIISRFATRALLALPGETQNRVVSQMLGAVMAPPARCAKWSLTIVSPVVGKNRMEPPCTPPSSQIT